MSDKYNRLDSVFQDILDSNGKVGLIALKTELNKIFKQKCTEIIYTNNTDKLFFGMSVYPVYKHDEFINSMVDYESKNNKCSVHTYVLEIDSKICNPALRMKGSNLTAILLHEIGHIVINDENIDDFRNTIEYYSAKTSSDVSREEIVTNSDLFKCAFYDFTRKRLSFFYRDKEELAADKFVHDCGYGMQLIESFNIITSHSLMINKDVKNKFLVLSWVLSIYKNMGLYRTDALRKLSKSKQLSPSVLEKRIFGNTINSFENGNKLTKSFNESVLLEAKNKFSFIDKMRLSGLRGLKNDLYELRIQVKSATDEETALYVLRLLNARITTIEEYINYHTAEMKEHELEEWESTLTQYIELREELTKKNTIKKVKMYGLFADYSTLPPEYQAQMMY